MVGRANAELGGDLLDGVAAGVVHLPGDRGLAWDELRALPAGAAPGPDCQRAVSGALGYQGVLNSAMAPGRGRPAPGERLAGRGVRPGGEGARRRYCRGVVVLIGGGHRGAGGGDPGRTASSARLGALQGRSDMLTGAGATAPVPSVLLIDRLCDAGSTSIVRPRCPHCRRVITLVKPSDGYGSAATAWPGREPSDAIVVVWPANRPPATAVGPSAPTARCG
jgi:hypothetical protein